MHWETQEWVLKEKFYFSEHVQELVHQEFYVRKDVNITDE
jgi:hypothetical protein